MKTTLRQIGNSRGIIIPAPLLAECAFENDIELTVEEGRLVVTPIKPARTGWFDQARPDQDEDAWAGMVETANEQEDWVW